MLEPAIIIIFTFLFLAWGANLVVIGSSAIARNLGISPLVIGLTVVAFGTALPEITISILSAIQGNPALGIGTAIGSNVANIGLVLGVTAMVAPMKVLSSTVRREYPIVFLIILLFAFLVIDGKFGRYDAIILSVAYILLISWFIRIGIRYKKQDPLAAEFQSELPNKMRMSRAIGWFLFGLFLLFVSSHFLVTNAIIVAKHLGISDLIIGLTIVSFGVCLPEIATTITAAIKNEHDLAIGNIIGANLFNLAIAIPVAGLIGPASLDMSVLLRDLPILLGITLMLFGMTLGLKGRGKISRFEGLLLFLTYIGYLILLYFDVTTLS